MVADLTRKSLMSRFIGLSGLSCLLLANSIDAQQVVFSRREYAARGTTFQQLWMWSATDGRLTQLTRSARDHWNPVCSPDGRQIFFDSGTNPFAQRHWRFNRETGIENGHTLLVGTHGEGSSSTIAKSDFFLLDLSRKTWTRAMTGNNAVWLPNGDAIIYETPRDLVPLQPTGRRRVWSAHLVRFDLATRTEARLTSGVTNNVQPAVCDR
jgi:Tol biopolymer transport system component